MTETEQLKIWKSDFGDAYTERNNYNPDTRIPAFRKMVGDLEIKKILEVGCNFGNNLVSLSRIGKDYELVGIEPNSHAIKKGRERGEQIAIIEGNGFEIPFVDSYFDLVFTAGVLIHIAPKDLPKAIDEMCRVSGRYVLIVEYHAEREEIVHYRGHNNLLFKNNFKKLFMERKKNLFCIREGFWDKKFGFDDCTWTLFEKIGRQPSAAPFPNVLK